ncbi:unnamed protein product, partial [Staurois parvus]
PAVLYHAIRPLPTRPPSIRPARISCYSPDLSASSHQALHLSLPLVIPLPQVGVLRGRDLVTVRSKPIPTIRGSGEQADWGLDSVPWGILSCGLLEYTRWSI